jgi:hypothetical protein
MQPKVMNQSIDYARAIAKLVGEMPVERAAQVYDFVRFLQIRSAHTQPIDHADDDWLNDTEEQMQAEDALWDAANVHQDEKFIALRETARAEIKAGTTQPMFDEHGQLVVDELTHHS